MIVDISGIPGCVSVRDDNLTGGELRYLSAKDARALAAYLIEAAFLAESLDPDERLRAAKIAKGVPPGRVRG